MTVYRGYMGAFQRLVVVHTTSYSWGTGDPSGSCRHLNPRIDLIEHFSPVGFDWGFEGDGPARLALAILADHLKDDARALRLYKIFERAVVARITEDDWCLSADDVGTYVAVAEALLNSTRDSVVDLDKFSKLLHRRSHA